MGKGGRDAQGSRNGGVEKKQQGGSKGTKTGKKSGGKNYESGNNLKKWGQPGRPTDGNRKNKTKCQRPELGKGTVLYATVEMPREFAKKLEKKNWNLEANQTSPPNTISEKRTTARVVLGAILRKITQARWRGARKYNAGQ